MTLKDDIKDIIEEFKKHTASFGLNTALIETYDGQLLKYVLQDMRQQLSDKTFEVARHRVPPINLLKKIIQKLSPIYNPAPARRVVDGNEADQELFNWYCEKIKPNSFFWKAVRYYSLCRSCLLYVEPHKMQPLAKVILNDRFFVMSKDPVDKMTPTHVVIFQKEKVGDKELWVFYASTDTEFLIFTEDEDILTSRMAEIKNIEGKNQYGRLPFTYATDSDAELFPMADSDMLAMTKLFPVILADLNYAVMFQCFSIYWAKNVKDGDMKIGPNVLWRLQKDETATGDPEVGLIKGNVDYDGVLSTVQSELAMWLNSKGIRPGSIGTLDKDNFANGISKMIDEMDTFELRQMLIDVFTVVEAKFWDNLLKYQHPLWVENDLIENKTIFTPTAKIETVFSSQQPMYSRGALVADLDAEVKAGFLPRKRAIAKLNPLMTEEEIDEMISEISEQNGNPQDANLDENGNPSAANG